MAVLSACNKEMVETPVETPSAGNIPAFTASIEKSATRTTLGEGSKVQWEATDELYIKYQTQAYRQVGFHYITGPIYSWTANGPEVHSIFSATPDPSDPTVASLTFKSYLTNVQPGYDDNNYTYQIQAVYPASLSDRETPGVFIFPATQTYDSEKICFAPMYFSGREKAFVMKNAAAILAVTVPASQMASVKSITVSSDQYMNGYCSFEIDESENPVMTIGSVDAEENKKIELICDASGSNAIIDGSTTFYICVPANHYEYLQIEVNDGTATRTMRTKKASGIDVERNRIYPVAFAANVVNVTAHMGHEYVDLGLPSGLRWATMNVGATAPEDGGGRFAWGETETKETYNWASYKYCMGSTKTMTKYCTSALYGYEEFRDDKRELEPADDAAHVNWGGEWRMPTKDEFLELRANCNSTAYTAGNTEFNGVAGIKYQSNIPGYTDRWIFFPATKYYWTSTLSTSFSYWAYYYQFSVNSNTARWDAYTRYEGYHVRPVLK